MSFYNSKNQRGFTLTEVLATVAIIAIILGFGIPKVMNVINDSSTEDFVSNAKVLEDSAHMYYRDNGVLPYTDSRKVVWKESEKSGNDVVLTLDSKAIIISRLLEVGATSPYKVLRNLVAENELSLIDYDAIRDYSKITTEDEGSDEFVIVDFVDAVTEDKYGNYENELAGYVFSYGVRDKSTGIVYSGAYDLTEETLDKIKDAIEKCEAAGDSDCEGAFDDIYDDITNGDDTLDSLVNKALAPYGLKAVKSVNNKDGSYDLQLTFTNRVVGVKNKDASDEENGLVTLNDLDSSTLGSYKNIKADEFTLTLYSYSNDSTKSIQDTQDFTFKLNSDGTYKVETSGNWGVKDGNSSSTANVVASNNTFKLSITGIQHKISSTDLYGVKLKDTTLTYRNSTLKYFTDSNGKSYVGTKKKADTDTEGSKKVTYSVLDEGINLLDLDNSSGGGSGDGGGKIPICDDCGLDQIIPDGSEEKPFEKYYEVYQENLDFNVIPKFHGLYLTNIEKGDLVVLKEVHRTKAYDWNRTVAFQANTSSNETDFKVYIPKSYLQNDFRVNYKSQYMYIVEVYKEDYVTSEQDKQLDYAKYAEYK